MNPHILGLRVASIIFGLMSLVQLGRLVIHPEIFVAGYRMPLWPSALAFIFFLGLSIWLWRIALVSPRILAANNSKGRIL